MKKQSRHICIVCKRKRIASHMIQYRSHWSCTMCLQPDLNERSVDKNEYPDERPGERPGENAPQAAGDPGHQNEKAGADLGNVTGGTKMNELRILNLYCGVGGNRHLWPENIHVTAVEHNAKIAAEYKRLYPNDIVIIGDAHQYLLKNYARFDLVWSSPPCQSHTKFNEIKKNRYPDMSLYQEIIILKRWCTGKFVVENVNPYYNELIRPSHTIGRHLFWSNFKISNCYVPHLPGLFDFGTLDDKKYITEWLGFDTSQSLYSTSKNSLQVLRNCVHPLIGQSIFNDFITSLK